jgi:hypothetical protein
LVAFSGMLISLASDTTRIVPGEFQRDSAHVETFGYDARHTTSEPHAPLPAKD